jgi:hypothetical protein
MGHQGHFKALPGPVDCKFRVNSINMPRSKGNLHDFLSTYYSDDEIDFS